MVLVIALVAYPLSWGPYLWLQGCGYIPEPLLWTDHVYDPARQVYDVLPDFARDAWKEYLGWWFVRIEMPYYHPETKEWE